ncbi:TIGR02328 family protein [Virgibacillus xinjiangensis]|uniref:TIGR02328 family protein n=1 Tax=Virgibacillus xinjiangensis TaxID=393090 RepID=A0ABV7CWB5_9BACI
MIPHLPRQQLLGQHRECCALRGKGWAKPHATVNYVFQYSPYRLYRYHQLIMREMDKRGYKHDPLWDNPYYRGKITSEHSDESLYQHDAAAINSWPIYPEHGQVYLKECLDNLREKGICLSSPNLPQE